MKYQHRSKICRSLNPECRIVEIVRIPKSWTELREALRDLTPARNYGIQLIYYGRCKLCGSRFEATSMRRNYCSEKCIGKAAVTRWYPIRLQRGAFKEAMIRKRRRERRIVEVRTAKQERVREQQERLQLEKLFREVVYGDLNKKIPYRYNYILNLLGGDEAKVHNKITDWYNKKFKFEQIPAEDQKVFRNCAKEWEN